MVIAAIESDLKECPVAGLFALMPATPWMGEVEFCREQNRETLFIRASFDLQERAEACRQQQFWRRTSIDQYKKGPYLSIGAFFVLKKILPETLFVF